MKVPLLSLAALTCALATARAQKLAPTPGAISAQKAANQSAVQGNPALAPYATARGGGQIQSVGSDTCAAPTFTLGNGPHAYDNGAAPAATTGAEGQSQVICNFQGSPVIQNDVWFTYTANATGTARLTTCGTTSSGTGAHDNRIAVYNGNACPASNAAALACDDDACGPSLESEVIWCATNAATYLVQIGNSPGAANGSGTWSVAFTPNGPANDECGGAILVPGAGPHAYDNSTATTGCVGQNKVECSQGSGSSAIHKDLWFLWTAPAPGTATLTTCSFTSGDTKIAVYPGTACPGTTTALACNDDACGPQQSCVRFLVRSGTTYLLQVGSSPFATGGPAAFTATVAPTQPCQVDDGTSENLNGFGAGGDLAWMNRFGSSTSSTTVDAILARWGAPNAPGLGPGNGSPARVAIWDDPDDDGVPDDLVLIQALNVTVANVDTAIFNPYPITQVSLNGYFFVGAAEPHLAGQVVAPMDTSCSPPGIGWVFGNNTATPANLASPTGNVVPPTSLNSIGSPAVLLVRPNCIASGPMSQFCSPGQGGVIPCPCGNPPQGTGLGCNNFGPGPAQSGTLNATGTASIANDTVSLHATGENNASLTVFWQGDAGTPAGGVKHGAGIRCVSVNQKRLYTGSAVGGAISRPTGAQPVVSVLGGASAGQTKRYYCVYRDPNAAGPCGNTSDTINTTNAGRIAWGP